MNKIDIETGYIYLGDIVITPNMKLNNFKKYEKTGLASITDIGKAGGFVMLKQLPLSNGIKAKVTFFISARNNTKVVIIPIIHNSKRIVASKKWLTGMIENCDIDDNEDPFFAEYSWGYISVKYVYDPRAGVMTEGNIKICYNNESSI